MQCQRLEYTNTMARGLNLLKYPFVMGESVTVHMGTHRA